VSEEKSKGPLEGIRILDLTRVIMGPLATQVLADQGADVILVEAKGGDTNRVMGPGPHPQLSGIALNLLRNKRSLDIDLGTPEGRAVVHRLAETCDVVVSTMRPQVLERLELDYRTLAALKPDLVYCQAQGFPLDSERASEPAYDDTIQVATGVADMTQRVWGEPTLLPTIFADKVCGLVMAQAIVAAIVHHERTGEGQHVEVAMQEAMTGFMLAEHGAGAIPEPPVSDDDRPPVGYPRVLSSERRPHRTKDGWVHLFPYLPKHYAAIFNAVGEARPDDPTYVDQRAALRNSDELYRRVRHVAPLRTTEEWLTFCREKGIPATSVVTLQEMVDGLPLTEHPVAGSYRVIAPMSRFSRSTFTIRAAAPLIGEQTAEIVAEAGE
jgi:crotonobetainyl-CoA:carnitine CoA-transferase CaiB-like acyl-CoA transferase